MGGASLNGVYRLLHMCVIEKCMWKEKRGRSTDKKWACEREKKNSNAE